MKQTAPDPPATILVYVGLDLIGDGLIKLPFVGALREAFPGARITWLAGKGKTVYAGQLKPLVAGAIDEVIEDAGIGIRLAEAVRRPLPGREFDLIVDSQRRVATTLVLRRIRHRRFISACAGYLFSDVRPAGVAPWSYRKPPAMIDQLLELVAVARGGAAVVPGDPGGVRLPAPVVAEAERLLPDGTGYVAMAPGAGDRRKCWPLDRFMELGRRLAARDVVPVYVLGPDEGEWREALGTAVPGARFPLCESERAAAMDPLLTIAVATRCRACVANDSGGGHLFAASGTPLVSLFGPTSPAKFAPRGPRVSVLEAAAYGSREMAAIPVEAVEAAVLRMVPV
ncbi:MAG: glycosyltransferase family 9 protein [Kiloniellaceae bacterium]